MVFIAPFVLLERLESWKCDVSVGENQLGWLKRVSYGQTVNMVVYYSMNCLVFHISSGAGFCDMFLWFAFQFSIEWQVSLPHLLRQAWGRRCLPPVCLASSHAPQGTRQVTTRWWFRGGGCQTCGTFIFLALGIRCASCGAMVEQKRP